MITPQIQNLKLTIQKLRIQKEIKLLTVLQQLEKASIMILCLNWARNFECGYYEYLSVKLGFIQLLYPILHIVDSIVS
jgi:hypothetical protein